MERVTKVDIAARVAKKGLTKRLALAAVEATLEALTEAFQKGERVQLVGFGTFEVRAKRARRGRNPQTGAPMMITARKIVKFKPGAPLCQTVNASQSQRKDGLLPDGTVAA